MLMMLLDEKVFSLSCLKKKVGLLRCVRMMEAILLSTYMGRLGAGGGLEMHPTTVPIQHSNGGVNC